MDDAAGAGSRIRPLDAIERRVLGVLIEKAKTTPDAYPLTLAGIVTGSNQKSNRDPLMTVDEDQVARALESLREAGVVTEIFGSGRVPRYRHHAYEWFGNIGKEDLSILAELLLRGEQSEGDLRGRASRMDPIPDLGFLRTRLDDLAARGLVVWLSPPGRGRILTHGLLPEEKLEKVRAKVGAAIAALPQGKPDAERDDDEPEAVAPSAPATAAASAAASSTSRPAVDQAPAPAAPLQAILSKIESLEAEVAALRGRLDALEAALGG